MYIKRKILKGPNLAQLLKEIEIGLENTPDAENRSREEEKKKTAAKKRSREWRSVIKIFGR